jgi:AraC-like DNA-binding protein
VLLIDSQRAARRLLSGAISDLDVTHVDGASAGWKVLSERPRADFDLVAVVARAAGRRVPAGVKLVQAIRMRWPWIPTVAILPLNASEGLFLEAFRAGRDDFLDRARRLGHLAGWRGARRARTDDRVARVVTFIGDHYTEQLSLDDLAHLVRMPRVQFARLFRTTTGSSLRDHIRTLRLTRARDLMRTTSMTLTDIALESGFYDLPHLDKAFRKQFGMSPNEFQRRPPGDGAGRSRAARRGAAAR